MEEQKKPDEEAEVRDQENREESESKPTETDTSGIDELQQKKVICAIAYIFGILFFPAADSVSERPVCPLSREPIVGCTVGNNYR